MKQLFYLSILSILFISCGGSERVSSTIISSFGEQPYVTLTPAGKVELVFANDESIYYSSSIDDGHSFSKPSLVAKHGGLVLGYSCGPSIATTSTTMVVIAPDTLGNLNSWSRLVNAEVWSGPFRVNDRDNSVGEFLSDITSAPDGTLHSVWIDTRFLKPENTSEHAVVQSKHQSIEFAKTAQEELAEMTPIGITKGELFEKIGTIPKNAALAFHSDQEGNLYWVFLDTDKNVLKAENYEEYKEFRKRNESKLIAQGKIYSSSSQDGGKTWSKSKLIYRSPDGSVCECCKPSIISDKKGNITVMFRNNLNGSRDLHFVQSFNGGETFSIAEKLGTGTWKINGCPMDGGDAIINNRGELKTVWQRKGDIFRSNSSTSENKIGSGRSPSISANSTKTYTIFSQGEDILTTTSEHSTPTKIGTGFSPKVQALQNGAIYFWVNSNGIHFVKVP